MLPPLPVRALLPTSSKALIGLSAPAFFFNVPWAHIPRQFFTQIAGLTHHCSCKSSHLFLHLNFLNLPLPRFFVRDAIFQSKLLLPSTEWPRWKVPPQHQGVCFHERGQGGRTLFACCSCHLSPQFQPLRGGGHSCCMTPQVLAGIMPARSNFLTSTFM